MDICLSREVEIKYLFQYVFKGHDRLTIHRKLNDEPGYDKVKNYQDCRYIATLEALYIMLEYHIEEENPTVERSEFHLYKRQQVYFAEGKEVEVANRPEKQSKLTT